jgi:TRAP-type C4-dicarboxylate transport system permease small subunit
MHAIIDIGCRYISPRIIYTFSIILFSISALYYGVSICIVTFASGLAVVTLNIHHRGFRGLPVPRAISFLALRVLGRILLIQKDRLDPIPEFGEGESFQGISDLRSQLSVSPDQILDIG